MTGAESGFSNLPRQNPESTPINFKDRKTKRRCPSPLDDTRIVRMAGFEPASLARPLRSGPKLLTEIVKRRSPIVAESRLGDEGRPGSARPLPLRSLVEFVAEIHVDLIERAQAGECSLVHSF